MQEYSEKTGFDKIAAFIEAHRQEMLAKWETFVNMEDFFGDVEATRRCRDWYISELTGAGFQCRIHEGMAPGYTEPFTAVLGEDRPGKPVIFAGHLDTVQPMGSFGEKPFRMEGGKAYGPGVLDMKGGLIIALYVVRALNELGYDAHPIKFVIDCEEESSHIEPDNRVTQFFIDECRGGLCCFDMETGNITNRLCVGRKSKYEWFATVHGVGGHSGNEFAKGRNALHEAVLKIADIIRLSDPEKGTTVTVSYINAGTSKVVCSIPDRCSFHLEARFTSAEEQERVSEAVKQILSANYIDGTGTEFRRSNPQFMAFQPNDGIRAFLAFMDRTAEDCGYPAFGPIELGGSSDSGAIAASGTPVLCACGPIGEFNHNIREYAVVESLFDRAKIYTAAILRLPESFV